jgi:hypothetical protein
MLVVSSREFRDNQRTYLDKIDNGIDILIQRGRNKSYKVSQVALDDTLMSKEDFFAKLDRASKNIKEGKGTVLNNAEEINAFFDSL